MSAAIVALLCAGELLLFLLPGAAIVSMLARKVRVSAIYCLIGSVVTSATLGYLAFWIYLGNKSAGQVFSYSLTAASLTVLIAALRRHRLRLNSDIVVPLAYTLCLALFYLSLLYQIGRAHV